VVTQGRRVGHQRRDHVTWSDLDVAHPDGVVPVETDGMERPEHVDELVPERVLERHPSGIDPARQEGHLLVLHVDAFHRSDAFREHEALGLGERWQGVEPPVALPHDGWVEALLDGGPDREHGREPVSLDAQVTTVADVDLVDGVEEVLPCVRREHLRQAGVHARPYERQAATRLPLPCQLELAVAQLDPRQTVGIGGMRL